MTRSFLLCFWHLSVFLFLAFSHPLSPWCTVQMLHLIAIYNVLTAVSFCPLYEVRRTRADTTGVHNQQAGRWSPCVIKKGQIPNPLFCPPSHCQGGNQFNELGEGQCIDCIECISLEVAILLRSRESYLNRRNIKGSRDCFV